MLRHFFADDTQVYGVISVLNAIVSLFAVHVQQSLMIR